MPSRLRRLAVSASLTAVLVGATACSSSSGGGSTKQAETTGATSGKSLTILIGSSGDAETNAVKAAASAWASSTGNTVNVQVASNLDQQLTQAMAGGAPPDVFYLSPSSFQTLAGDGSLAAYGSQLSDGSDFYPALTKAFTYKNQLFCAPKDFSTLAIEINTDLWKAAGLTDADLPTTWDKLEVDAKKLTSGKVTGLVIGDTLDRVGAFMAEAGGGYLNSDGTKFTFDSDANVQGLTYVQKLAKEGVLKFPKQVGAGWGGEAFGKGLAAMTVEGNWIQGAMTKDYPNVKYLTVPMPTGPSGKQGTLSFTNCWGIAAKSKSQTAAVKLVEALTAVPQQLTFAKTIGVMPSRSSAKDQYISQNPASKAFIDEATYAVPQVTTKGFAQVQSSFDSSVIGLATGASDPKTMLTTLQQNAQSLLG